MTIYSDLGHLGLKVGDRGRSRKALGLSFFSLLGLIAGAILGATVARLANPDVDGLTGIAVGLAGIIVGVPLAQTIVGVVWAKVNRRVLWLPPVALLAIFTVATIVALMLATDSVMGYILPVIVLIVALVASFLVGFYTPYVKATRTGG